uniref:Putative secreted protein n=1 Tax=Anopheles darlingi TaxID=43151 RepID=A0A2M4DIQ1_ANODA
MAKRLIFDRSNFLLLLDALRVQIVQLTLQLVNACTVVNDCRSGGTVGVAILAVTEPAACHIIRIVIRVGT